MRSSAIRGIVAYVLFVVILLELILWANGHVGTTHSGIVLEAACNGGFGSTSGVVVAYGNATQAYRVSYGVCLDFYVHARFDNATSVTIQDDAWNDRIAWYRFDGGPRMAGP